MFGSRGHYPARLRVSRPSPELCDFYLKEWQGGKLYRTPELFPRISSRSLFDNDNPLELDIGSATAEYLCSHASDRSDVNFIGVERSQKPLFYAVNKCASMQLKNVRFIRADVRLVYPLLEHSSLSTVYLHFPVPSLQERQVKHKIFTGQFLEYMEKVLCGHGVISIMTDSEPYYYKMIKLLSSDSWYTVETDQEKCSSIDPAEKSYYHRLWHAKGKETYRFLLIKR